MKMIRLPKPLQIVKTSWDVAVGDLREDKFEPLLPELTMVLIVVGSLQGAEVVR